MQQHMTFNNQLIFFPEIYGKSMKLNNQIIPLVVEVLECREYGLPKKNKLNISLRSTCVAPKYLS